MPLQLRRGLEEDRTSITPAVGEPIYTTDTKRLYIGDGSTPGGVGINFDQNQLTATTQSTSQVPIHEVAAAQFSSLSYNMEITCGSSRHVSEIKMFHDGATTYITEYAVMHNNGKLADFNADIVSGNLRLLVTPLQSAPTIFKFTARAIEI